MVLVGISIVSLKIVQAHPLSRAVYNVVIIYLLVELHSGFDFPWMLQNVVPFELIAGSKRHEAHHRNRQVYYQKFFTIFDNLCGFTEDNTKNCNKDDT